MGHDLESLKRGSDPRLGSQLDYDGVESDLFQVCHIVTNVSYLSVKWASNILHVHFFSIYGVHDEAKDKAFELEMSWICDESNREHQRVSFLSCHVFFADPIF